MKGIIKYFCAFFAVLILMLSFVGCEENVPVLPCTVTFDTNGGRSVDARTVKVVDKAPVTSKTGYVFAGWYLDQVMITPASFPLTVTEDMTLYAKWLKIEGSQRYASGHVKFLDNSTDSALYYYVTPNGFDLNALATEGYHMNITVTYDVRYEKDYSVLWDIGYVGSPKYEVSLMDSEGLGQHQHDIGTNKTADTRTISIQKRAVDLVGEKIILKFSTDNVQNKIYFENIVVTYECFR